LRDDSSIASITKAYVTIPGWQLSGLIGRHPVDARFPPKLWQRPLHQRGAITHACDHPIMCKSGRLISVDAALGFHKPNNSAMK
jgi:hypothetical protein